MSGFLNDLSAPNLEAAIRANLFEWYRYLGRSSKAMFYDSPQLTWLRTGISNSFVNCVLRADLYARLAISSPIVLKCTPGSESAPCLCAFPLRVL